ncbi:hypothetical protein PtB15_1B353 [Puccinia triticina]|nr:hypothetical protein PtB15_1B353 [Puccinia triticina]
MHSIKLQGSELLAARPGSLRAHEQAIVRWQDDTSAGDCTLCHTPFDLRIRKHHCRLCGQLVCFKPHSAGPRRCSSLIRVDWDPLLHRNTIRTRRDCCRQNRPGMSGLAIHPAIAERACPHRPVPNLCLAKAHS